MIDVIITAYHMHDLIDRAIASVLMQDMREGVTVTIVDDADEEPYDDVAERFRPFLGDHIRIIRKEENTGCGDSRQVGIDACTARYFTFLDADDVFCTPFALSTMVNTAEEHNADIVSTNFVEEIDVGKFVTHEKDRTWMHGKLYRTEFVHYNDIRFNLARSNEDSAFNTLCYSLCETQCHVDYVTYTWMNNPASLTRTRDWLRETVCEFVGNATYVVDTLLKRRLVPSKFADVFLSYLTTIYGYYCQFLAEGREKSFLDEYLAAARKYWEAGKGERWFYDPKYRNVLATYYNHNGVLDSLRARNLIVLCDINHFAKMIGGNKHDQNRKR